MDCIVPPLTLLLAPGGLLLDRLWGEPSRWHPLVGFGGLAGWLEGRLYGGVGVAGWNRRVRGGVALLLALLPGMVLAVGVGCLPTPWGEVGSLLLLYLCVGGRSLEEHARVVERALMAGDLAAARRGAGALVSRETGELDREGVARATVESVLENGNDALFAPLFWFAVAGAPGVVLHRLVNTLDAMWGYRNERYREFGSAAARLDDLLNHLPARLTALTYLLLGERGGAWRAWRRDAPLWKSPNAGPVMASGAGSLGLRLGGAAVYHGVSTPRPPLGDGRPPEGGDVGRAVGLVRRGAWGWGVVLALGWWLG